ncbi:MAG TPA: hypothetical protein VK589_11905 [Chryseolinea sp.]|nr:hypothetical protein [Chryseolinea sp.]
MRDKVTVVLRNGNEVTLAEWQKIYGLPVDSDKIGRYFSLSESRFIRDIQDYGELVVNELLMTVLDNLREAINSRIIVNSFNRNKEHQEDLHSRGFKTAVHSPHVVKMAADIDTVSPAQTREWVKYVKQVASILNIKVRIGFEEYLKIGQTFIHIDVCPEYYADGKPYHKLPHPAQWEFAITW